MPRLRESQQVSSSLPSTGRHELPREITPQISPLGASGAKDDAHAHPQLRARTREKKGRKNGVAQNLPPAFAGTGEMVMHRVEKVSLL